MAAVLIKIMSKKIYFALVIAVIITIAGVAGWVIIRKQNSTAQDNIQNLKTYQDQNFGFKFQYPDDKINNNINSIELDIVNYIDAVGQVLRTDVDNILNSDIGSACENATSIIIGTCQSIKKGDSVILYTLNGITPPEELAMVVSKIFIIKKDKVILVNDIIKTDTAAKYDNLIAKFYKENTDVKQYDYENEKWQTLRSQLTEMLRQEVDVGESAETRSDMNLLKEIIESIKF